jgi:hypothetical protein
MVLYRFVGCGDGKRIYTAVWNAASPNFFLFCEPA